nr:hypothetical protein [Tanacetum cinerariifolium]
MRDKGTAKVKTVNGEAQIQAIGDKMKVIITEESIRRDLRFKDEGRINCLSNEVIFEQVTLIGAKTTVWNELSSTMAYTIMCLATNQKFNFSKYIFDNMVKHLDGGVKFLMYPRFVQVFLDNQVEGMDKHNAIFVISSHTKKVFANMKREGKDLSGKKKQKSRRKQRKEIEVPSPSSDIPNEEGVLDLEEAKTVQAKKIASLKKRLKKLEQKKKSRTSGLKRLRKRRMNEKDMFEINYLNGDEVVVDVSTSENVEQSAKVVEKEVSTADLVTTDGEVVSTAIIEVTTVARTLQIYKDELTLAQTLIENKTAGTAKVKTVNGEAQIQAIGDKMKVIITEESIRRDLRFKDEGRINCLSNEVIFEQVTLIG